MMAGRALPAGVGLAAPSKLEAQALARRPSHDRKDGGSLSRSPVRLTYIGGPTALLEVGGLRLLTDPTFDPGGMSTGRRCTSCARPRAPRWRPSPWVTLTWCCSVTTTTSTTSITPGGGCSALPLRTAARVVTTVAGAGRLGARAIGLAPWESEEVPAPDGRMLRITATPARHGPRPGTGDRVLRGAGRRARARGKP
jgi:hypothetical protein